MVSCVKIGKNSARNQPKALIPQSKNQIFHKFLTYFPKTSYENPELILEDFFRIKSAGSSNYRGLPFFASARHGQKAQPINQCRRSAVLWRKPRIMNNVPRDMRYAILDTQYSHLSSVLCLLSSAFLYICREPSTNQLLFMQNKPNFQDAQMNVNIFSKMAYQNFIPLAGQKNKPNSKPNKPCPACPLPNKLLPSFGAGSAVEKFLSLCPASVTIIRKSVIRQFKKGSPEMATFRNSDKDNFGTQPGWVRSKFGDKLSCQRNSLRKR